MTYAAPNTLQALCIRWGAEFFERSAAGLVDPLPLRAADAAVLTEVGLPTGPEESLALSLRFENVQILHRPSQMVPVHEAEDFQIGAYFPGTGNASLDQWADLRRFVVLGEVPNDFARGSLFVTRYVCVDEILGHIWWVYPQLIDESTQCEFFNSSLSGYLESLLAYKEFRSQWTTLLQGYPDEDQALGDQAYQQQAEAIHQAFRERLAAVDPLGYREGFWECHAWNEAILMGID